MVFSSIEFIWLFMPVVLVLYLALPPRYRNVLLASMSLAFYVWGARSLLFLFLGSILINYVAGLLIGRLREFGRESAMRKALVVAIGLNLLLLFTWKYAVFAAQQVNAVIGAFGAAKLEVPAIVLPIGIS